MHHRPNELGTGCAILDLDYLQLSSMQYAEAVNYLSASSSSDGAPKSVSCLQRSDTNLHYEMKGTSIVPEVETIVYFLLFFFEIY